MNTKKGHRKFFKDNSQIVYKSGTFLPEQWEITEEHMIDLKWVKKQPLGTVIFIMSTSCDACNFSLLKEFSEKHRSFSYLMLLQSDHVKAEELSEMYGFEFPINICDLRIIDKTLDYGGIVPYFLFLNNVGQVVVGGVVPPDIQMMERQAEPFLRVKMK